MKIRRSFLIYSLFALFFQTELVRAHQVKVYLHGETSRISREKLKTFLVNNPVTENKEFCTTDGCIHVHYPNGSGIEDDPKFVISNLEAPFDTKAWIFNKYLPENENLQRKFTKQLVIILPDNLTLSRKEEQPEASLQFTHWIDEGPSNRKTPIFLRYHLSVTLEQLIPAGRISSGNEIFNVAWYNWPGIVSRIDIGSTQELTDPNDEVTPSATFEIDLGNGQFTLPIHVFLGTPTQIANLQTILEKFPAERTNDVLVQLLMNGYFR